MQPWSLPFALVQKFVATVTKTLVPLVDSNEITISKERQEILMHPILRNAYVIEEWSYRLFALIVNSIL